MSSNQQRSEAGVKGKAKAWTSPCLIPTVPLLWPCSVRLGLFTVDAAAVREPTLLLLAPSPPPASHSRAREGLWSRGWRPGSPGNLGFWAQFLHGDGHGVPSGPWLPSSQFGGTAEWSSWPQASALRWGTTQWLDVSEATLPSPVDFRQHWPSCPLRARRTGGPGAFHAQHSAWRGQELAWEAVPTPAAQLPELRVSNPQQELAAHTT